MKRKILAMLSNKAAITSWIAEKKARTMSAKIQQIDYMFQKSNSQIPCPMVCPKLAVISVNRLNGRVMNMKPGKNGPPIWLNSSVRLSSQNLFLHIQWRSPNWKSQMWRDLIRCWKWAHIALNKNGGKRIISGSASFTFSKLLSFCRSDWGNGWTICADCCWLSALGQ